MGSGMRPCTLLSMPLPLGPQWLDPSATSLSPLFSLLFHEPLVPQPWNVYVLKPCGPAPPPVLCPACYCLRSAHMAPDDCLSPTGSSLPQSFSTLAAYLSFPKDNMSLLCLETSHCLKEKVQIPHLVTEVLCASLSCNAAHSCQVTQ